MNIKSTFLMIVLFLGLFNLHAQTTVEFVPKGDDTPVISPTLIQNGSQYSKVLSFYFNNDDARNKFTFSTDEKLHIFIGTEIIKMKDDKVSLSLRGLYNDIVHNYIDKTAYIGPLKADDFAEHVDSLDNPIFDNNDHRFRCDLPRGVYVVSLSKRDMKIVALSSTTSNNSANSSDYEIALPPDYSLRVSLEANRDTLVIKPPVVNDDTLAISDPIIIPGTELPDLETLSADQNYIAKFTSTTGGMDAGYLSIDYYDGLGRPMQTVQKGITPNGSDLATYQEYDGAGRESNSWLPVVLSNNNGAFVSLSTIKSNINASYPNEAKPYTLPVYEASPLNRVLEQYGPGQAWQNNSRSAKTAYLTNIAGNDTLNCIYYKAEATSTDTLVTITNGGNYTTAELYVTRKTDEDGNASFEFKDKLGQVVLTRQIGRNGTAKTIYDTYYIYDDFGNLAAVLPPLASDGMKSGTSWTNVNSAILRNYAYLYMYDGRNRCKAKRLPGCSWNYYVYDTGDRLIFSQDGEQRKKGEWGFTLPDIFSRTCATGICKNSFSALAATPPLNNVVVKVTRDNTTGTYKGYTLSGVTLVSPTVLNVNYYDDYAFMGKNGIPDSTDTDFRYEPISGFGIRYKESAKTFLTGTLTARLDGSTTPTYLYSVMYYDNRSRVIQTKSNNHLTSGIEKEYVAYNFTGQPTQKKHIHFATGKTTQTEIYSYDYDHAGRLLTVKHKLNSGTNTGRLVTLVKNTYDELGRLKTNMKDSLAALTTTYAYNVRSWMKSSNSPLFSQTLYYNDSYGSNTPRYNGNISAMSWTTSGDKTRGYNFAYDNLSRLTAAGYLEGGVANTNYSTSYTYDKHGNMTNLIRNGRTGTSTFGTIDNLSMSYTGNQLIKADDAGVNVTLSESMDFKNNSTAAKEYYYDKDGNLTKDLNKGIDSIRYNLLNLPEKILFNVVGKPSNEYIYAADGRKLRVVHKASTTMTTDYVGNVIYENGALKRILVDGGYIEGGAYYFYLTDHLGNNRVVANASGGIVQTSHYYPFGMPFTEGVTASQQPYKYNGKELDTERGLNLYDYGARMYDPTLGRFHTQDRFAEKYMRLTPYQYAANNPMKFIDLNGDSIVVLTAPKGAHGAGHMAMLIQNKEGKWSLWSKNGTNESSGMSGTSSGDDKGNDKDAPSYDTPEDFINSDANPTNSETGEREYTEGVLIPATPGEDRKAENGAQKVLNEDYNVITSNCAQTVQSGLRAAGKKDGTPSTITQVMSYAINPLGAVKPNKIYNRIKEQNSVGKIYTPNQKKR